MTERIELARLRITPAFGLRVTYVTIRLIQKGVHYYIETTKQSGRQRKHRQRIISAECVIQQMNRLRNASLPAFPISPQVCDGTNYELTIYGECSDLTLSWWTIAPKGAEALDDFANWLCEWGLTDQDMLD